MTLQKTSRFEETNPFRAGWAQQLAGALGLAMAVVTLGIVARLPGVTGAGLQVDQELASGRSEPLTKMALLLTGMAQPAVGVAVAVIAPLLLVMLRHRVLAVRVVALFGAALGGAGVVKVLIAEPRPPATVAAVARDAGHSFPSGHVTVAATICVAVWMLPQARPGVARVVLGGLAGVFALGVGWSRLYLGVHYLPDVIGSYLVVAAAALAVHALCAIPVVRALLLRLDLYIRE